MKIKIAWIFSLLIVSTLYLHAEDVTPKGRFLQANQLFEKGDLPKAEALYMELVGQGFEGPALFYNLGNLYYRKGERGKAILWYERAERLAPRDSDIEFNLSLARSHIKDEKSDPLEKIFLIFTNKEVGWTLSILSLIFFGLLGSRLLGWVKIEWNWPPMVMWVSGLLLIISMGWFGINTMYSIKPLAILVAPVGEVRNGPGNDYAVGCTLPEGSRILVLDRRPEWIHVGVIQQELKGWMPAKDVELISNFSSI